MMQKTESERKVNTDNLTTSWRQIQESLGLWNNKLLEIREARFEKPSNTTENLQTRSFYIWGS